MYSGVSQESKIGSSNINTSGKNLFDCFKSSSIKKTTETEYIKKVNVAENIRANIVPCFDAVAKENTKTGFATIDYFEQVQKFEPERPQKHTERA